MNPKGTFSISLTIAERASLDACVKRLSKDYFHPESVLGIAWVAFLGQRGTPDTIDRLLAVCEAEMCIEMTATWAETKTRLRRLVVGDATPPDSGEGVMPGVPFLPSRDGGFPRTQPDLY